MESDFINLTLVEISQQCSGGLLGEEGACLFLIDDIVLGIIYITLFIFFLVGVLYHHPPFQSCLSQRTAANDTILFMSVL